MINALVTGATSTFGRRVVELLEFGGMEVVTAGRSEPAWRNGAHIHLDLSDAESVGDLPRAAGDMHVIVHLAAAVPLRATDDDPERMIAVNELGTVHLLRAFGAGAQRFVLASTAEVYGGSFEPRLLREDEPVRPPSAYAVSKLAAEAHVRLAAEQFGTTWAALRYTVLYGGPDRISRAIPAFVKSALNGESPVVHGGDELRDYLHVDEAARATVLAAVARTSGIYNIASGRPMTIRGAATAIARAIDPELIVTSNTRRRPGMHAVLDTSRAERDFGFIAERFFPAGLEEQIAWHRANA